MRSRADFATVNDRCLPESGRNSRPTLTTESSQKQKEVVIRNSLDPLGDENEGHLLLGLRRGNGHFPAVARRLRSGADFIGQYRGTSERI